MNSNKAMNEINLEPAPEASRCNPAVVNALLLPAVSVEQDSTDHGKPTPLLEMDQLVTAERLREIVWDPASRPSLQWVRKQTKRRLLPHIRRGRLIFYRPRSVVEWYAQKESKPATMK